MVNAATAAGAEIVKVKSGQYSVREKADLSPVTDADYAAQNTIAAALFPLGIPMISEESAAADFSVRGLWDRVFIIDPLDGTKEFINGSHQYGVNIALVEQGAPVAGVIFLPEDGLLYVGATDFPVMRIECAAGQQFELAGTVARGEAPLRAVSGPLCAVGEQVASYAADGGVHRGFCPATSPG